MIRVKSRLLSIQHISYLAAADLSSAQQVPSATLCTSQSASIKPCLKIILFVRVFLVPHKIHRPGISVGEGRRSWIILQRCVRRTSLCPLSPITLSLETATLGFLCIFLRLAITHALIKSLLPPHRGDRWSRRAVAIRAWRERAF